MILKNLALSASLLASIAGSALFATSVTANTGVNEKCGKYECDKPPGLGEQCCPFSDERLKNDIQALRDPLAKLLELRGVSYSYKNDGTKDIGLIAQDVEKVYPELIHEKDGFKQLDYQKLVAPLIESVRTLNQRIVVLEAQAKPATEHAHHAH